MNILVIATGGTIGSVFDGSSIDVSSDHSSAVIELYKKNNSSDDFSVIEPVDILSERISSSDFNALAKALLSADISDFDGVILTCGSDNLAYIASFTAMLASRFGKPAAIVASDKVLSDAGANGYPNFLCAVELIRRGIAGVFVPYRNSDGVMYIHSAFDIRQADLSDDFYSFGGAYAVYENGDIILCKNYIKHDIPDIFSAGYLPDISDSVLLLHPYPMLDYGGIRTGEKKAVLHTLYHSSTLDSGRFIDFMKTLGDVPVYLASFKSGRNIYKTAADAIAAGAIPLTDISPECAYMKLLLATAQDKLGIREFMERI